jgi:hypothetical protein
MNATEKLERLTASRSKATEDHARLTKKAAEAKKKAIDANVLAELGEVPGKTARDAAAEYRALEAEAADASLRLESLAAAIRQAETERAAEIDLSNAKRRTEIDAEASKLVADIDAWMHACAPLRDRYAALTSEWTRHGGTAGTSRPLSEANNRLTVLHGRTVADSIEAIRIHAAHSTPDRVAAARRLNDRMERDRKRTLAEVETVVTA